MKQSMRAHLGVDGNAGFALVGPNIQEGEAEFVPIDDCPHADWRKDQREAWAATQAYRRLQARLPDVDLSYYLGPSHPRHC